MSMRSTWIVYLPIKSFKVGAIVYTNEVVLNFMNSGSLVFLDSYVKYVTA